MNTLPKITKKQTDLLNYLYKFYFLNTNQFQKLLNHKNPQKIQKWLKDLKDKNYIATYDFKGNKFKERSEPFVYYLTTLARLKLKGNDKCDMGVLNRIYQTKQSRSDTLYLSSYRFVRFQTVMLSQASGFFSLFKLKISLIIQSL